VASVGVVPAVPAVGVVPAVPAVGVVAAVCVVPTLRIGVAGMGFVPLVTLRPRVALMRGVVVVCVRVVVMG